MPPEPNLAESHGEEIELPILALNCLLEDTAEQYGDKIALVCKHQPPDYLGQTSQNTTDGQACLRWTHSQLRSTSHRFASKLHASGVRKGMRIAAFLRNGAQYAIGLYAAALLGCAFAPINAVFVDKADELNHMLGLAEPSVLMVWDARMARSVSENLSPELAEKLLVKIVCNERDGLPKGWSHMHAMLAAPSQSGTPTSVMADSAGDDLALIIFTSGTTSRPKGVRQLNRTIVAGIRSSAQVLALDSSRSFCNSLPPFHVFAIVYLLNFWSRGGSVCFPAEGFDPGAVVQAIQEERLTNLAGVPAMMNAIISHPSTTKDTMQSLIHVSVSAAVILPETMRRIGESLGVKKVSASFGMSEAIPITGTPFRELPREFNEQIVTSGRSSPGACVRICAPETRTVVARGQTGELHVSGPMVADGYLGGVKGGFYFADGRSWIATGDQARMEQGGDVFILGRYKDLIIRAGENIAPASIEAVLDTLPSVSTSQVIGIPDEIAGEVPFAILKSSHGAPVDMDGVRNVVLDKLGATFVPAETVSIQDLGISDFPKTESGKVKKNELAQKVADFLHDREDAETTGDGDGDDEDRLRQIWARLLGVSKESLTNETSMHDMADSVVIMRAANKIEQQWGFALTMRELIEHPTVRDLAKLIKVRKETHVPKDEPLQKKRNGPPLLDDLTTALNNPEAAKEIQVAVAKTADSMGLSWEEDIEDVLPIWDWGQVCLRRLRSQSWNHRHAFLATRASPMELREALEHALGNQPMLRTIVAKPAQSRPLHVVVRPSAKWFRLVLTESDQVETADDLRTLSLNDPKLDFAAAPGPLFRAIIAPVKETGTAGLIYQVQHSCFDGLSIPNLIDDLETVLEQGNGARLPPRMSYKHFTDTLFLHRGSRLAQNACEFHVQRLRGLATLGQCLWPSQRAPEWFKGSFDDADSTVRSERRLLDGGRSIGVDGITKQVRLPGLQQTKEDCGVSAPAIFKTALALLNTRHTGQTKAVFTNYEAGRDWPFQPSWMADLLPNAMNVNGPTLEAVLNVIAIHESETCAELVKRVHEEQVLLTKHAHAPLFDIEHQLGPDGIQLVESMRRQIFNWLPGLAGVAKGRPDNAPLRRLQLQSRSDVGLLWNCGMLDGETFHMNASYDDVQLRATEVEDAVQELFGIAAWITDPKNWSSPVGSMML